MDGVAVFAGGFASQPLAFAHLLDACDGGGLALDFDHVEVICGGNSLPRLTHAFGNDTARAIQSAQGGDTTLILIFPEALIPGARLFPDTPHLRPLGRFATPYPRRRA
ncbi:hypothetical protein KTJ87_11795 [Rhodobacteraceae bacterium ASV31]|nr:hypothetical protein [Anianabacter salinae]